MCLNEEKHIGMLFKDINKEIVCILNRELEIYGITLMQHEVLHYIYFHEQRHDINQKDIERFFNSTNPTITGILNRLQAKGLVIRQPSTQDARYKIIKLTEEGRTLVCEQLSVGPHKMEKRLTKNLSQEEIKQLKQLLIAVLDGLED